MLHRRLLHLSHVHGLSCHGIARAPLIGQGAQRLNGGYLFPLFNGELEECRAILIIGRHQLIIGKGQGRGHINHIIEPHYRLNTLKGGHALFKGLRLSKVHIMDQHRGIGNGLIKLLTHQGHRLGGLGFRGQIIHHVVVGFYEGNKRSTDQSQDHKDHHYYFTVANQYVRKSIHDLIVSNPLSGKGEGVTANGVFPGKIRVLGGRHALVARRIR